MKLYPLKNCRRKDDKKVVIFSLSLGLALSFLGARQAKTEVVSLRATCELKDNLSICSVTSKNRGSQVLHINPNHFSLITHNGTSHPYSIETYSDYGYFLSKDLSPEEELKGKLVFEVFGKPEYLVFDDGGGAKAKVSLTRETLKGKEVEPIEPPKVEERKELALLAEIEPEGIYQKEVEVEDLRKTLSEKESELAFLKESLKKLEDKLTEVMEEEKEEAEGLKTELEEQNLKLKEKEEFLSKCQEDKAIKEELLSKCQGEKEKEKGPDNKSKLIPFVFLIGAVALIVSAR